MILKWLDDQKEYPKFFWKNRAVCGLKKECFEVPTSTDATWFGGMDFDERKCSLWEGFPKTYFFIPKYMKEGTIIGTEKIVLKNREETPLFCDWQNLVENALENAKFEKVVLARKVSYKIEGKVPCFSLLRNAPKNSILFGFAPNENMAFIGATPEILYKREKDLLSTNAVAGTAQDINAFTSKEDVEFDFVSKYLQHLLNSFCSDVHISPKTHIHTGKLYHNHRELCGKTSLSDKEILSLLHPTPAIGGYPKNEALAFIKKHEPFSRGWYASPIGYISKNQAEFAVAIRSMLIKNSSIHLFSGAGIVEGSDPQKEWEELEAKLWITST